MKILCFHLMPYRDLPGDFRETHDSVCVDIDPHLIDSVRVAEMYQQYMDELVLAAELGFDGVCVNEHHASAYGMMPSPNLIAAALARQTTSAAICVLGNSIALYNPPTRVAEELGMIDCISGGRLIAGFPLGTPMDSAYAYSQNPSLIRARYLEAFDLILRAWNSTAPFPFNGRFTKLRYVNALPRPLQSPHPPIWIPGGGSIETWQWCAEAEHVYCHVSYYGVAAAEETLDGFWQAAERAGRDRNPYRAAFLQIIGVADTQKMAVDLYREAGEYLYRNCLHIDSRFVGPPGYATEATARAKAASRLERAARACGAEGIGGVAVDWDGIRRNGYVVVGSPDEVADRLLSLATRLNVGHLMTLLQFGNMNTELARYNMRLFATEVIPRLRDRFADRWEDRWWPHAAKSAPRESRAP
jgi:alkanesulfonate monooxygenase SsuD/methylene tetrahydromethanopterin reductase-like flavin-dependent oxidoreductase (luciferase family)